LSYKTLNPIELAEPRAYFTDCDSVVQSLFGITKPELITKLKVLSLLNEKVVVATSHILQSNLAFEALTAERLLLREGILVPALSSQFKEFDEYIKKRRKRLRRFVIGSEATSPRLIKRADRLLDVKNAFLAENVKEVVAWEVTTTAEEFKAGLLNDLKSPTSLLNKCINLPENVLDTVISQIMSVQHLSRTDIERIVAPLPLEKRLLVLNSANLHYFLAGSHAHKSDMVTHYNTIDFIKDKANRSFVLKKSHHPNYCPKEAFEAFLDAFDMPQDSIQRLTDEQIVEIRKDAITRKFREKYRKTLSLVREGRALEAKEFKEAEYLPAKTEIKQVIENEVEKEAGRDKLVYQVRRGLKKASYVSAIVTVTGFVFPPLIPQVATLPIALYEVVDPFISKLWDSIGNVEFIVFASKIGVPRRVPWRT